MSTTAEAMGRSFSSNSTRARKSGQQPDFGELSATKTKDELFGDGVGCFIGPSGANEEDHEKAKRSQVQRAK